MTLWLVESPLDMLEGETITYSVLWEGATTVASTSATVYRNGADVTSTVMSAGSHTQSGNVSTLKPLVAQSNHGGSKYIVAVQATVDGNTELRKFEILVIKPDEEQS